MNCPSCNTEVREGSQYCHQCGAQVELSTAAHASTLPRKPAKPVAPFASAHTRAMLIILLLAAGILVDLGAIGAGGIQVGLAFKGMAGLGITDDEIATVIFLQQGISFVHIAVFLATSILFLMWLYRTHKNLPAFGARELSFSPRSAIVYWFIPLVSFFVPYQVAREIWQASDPAIGASSPVAWKNKTPSPVLGWWWVLFLLSSLVGNIVTRYASSANTLDDVSVAGCLMAVSDAIHIAAAVVTILMVRSIDYRQDAKSKRIAGLAAMPSPAA